MKGFYDGHMEFVPCGIWSSH